MEHAHLEVTLRRQLTAFANFTTRALGESNIDSLMMHACLHARAGMKNDPCKTHGVCAGSGWPGAAAGVGWKDGYVGQYQVPPDPDTPIGYAFSFSEPVPITDYNSEKNNLSLVAAMVSVQARRMPESGGREELVNAVARINNLALVHDRLQLFTSSVTNSISGSFARCFAHYCRLAWP